MVSLLHCVLTGDVESTQPTKTLMSLAEYIDTHTQGGCEGGGGGGGGGGGLREWFLSSKSEVLDLLSEEVERHEREKRGKNRDTER